MFPLSSLFEQKAVARDRLLFHSVPRRGAKWEPIPPHTQFESRQFMT